MTKMNSIFPLQKKVWSYTLANTLSQCRRFRCHGYIPETRSAFPSFLFSHPLFAVFFCKSKLHLCAIRYKFLCVCSATLHDLEAINYIYVLYYNNCLLMSSVLCFIRWQSDYCDKVYYKLCISCIIYIYIF